MDGKSLDYLDYKNILTFYDVPIPSRLGDQKKLAEKIISDKLCKCIKKVSKSGKISEKRAIGICTDSVINKKGFILEKFKCKKKKKGVTMRKRGKSRKTTGKVTQKKRS